MCHSQNQCVMASKDDFPPIIGTYNGINYYIQNGKQRQRKAGGGFTSESIKNNPKMQGIRDGNTELALCSKFNKEFKLAMFPFLNKLEDGTLHQRLMKLFMAIKNLDGASKGLRTVGGGLSCDMGRKLLSQFKFTNYPTTTDIIGPVYDFNPTTGVLNADAFDPTRLKFPKGSTHFFINYGVLEYDLKSKVFKFTLNKETLIIEKNAEARALVLEVPEPPNKENLVFGVVKVQFYQHENCQFYKSHAKGSVGIGVV